MTKYFDIEKPGRVPLAEYIIKDFLSEDFSREIVIKNHVTGFRVSVKDSEYGEIAFDTGGERNRFSGVIELVMSCIKQFNNNIKKKEAEKIEKLNKRKKEIQRELEEVSNELKSIMLKTFEEKF